MPPLRRSSTVVAQVVDRHDPERTDRCQYACLGAAELVVASIDVHPLAFETSGEVQAAGEGIADVGRPFRIFKRSGSDDAPSFFVQFPRCRRFERLSTIKPARWHAEISIEPARLHATKQENAMMLDGDHKDNDTKFESFT